MKMKNDHLPVPPHVQFWEVTLKDVTVTDVFWAYRQKLMASTSLILQHEKLKSHHHIENFHSSAGKKGTYWSGIFYYDSDVYKWIEAAIYANHVHYDRNLSKLLEETISLVIEAQQPDGYINTFFTCIAPDERMKNFFIMHELYCGGHLIEAAIARYLIQGKDDLLIVAKKFVEFLLKIQTKRDKSIFVPGHPEIEIALFKLYRVTRDDRYLELAEAFINNRGTNPHPGLHALKSSIHAFSLLRKQKQYLKMFKEQAGRRAKSPGISNDDQGDLEPYRGSNIIEWMRFLYSVLSGKYSQQSKPVRRLDKVEGHAVRGTYLYSAMTDLFMETGDVSLLNALRDIWRNMTEKRMYITGGIGSVPVVEGWGRDHELPNEKAYCETCAAIGNLLWNWRMLLATGETKHAELFELVLYNSFLAGWSIDGRRYSYRNPLESRTGNVRHEWFPTACCPTNIGRVFGSLGKYIYTRDLDNNVWIHQYIGSIVRLKGKGGEQFSINVESGFPWHGQVETRLHGHIPGDLTLRFRVPSWAEEYSVTIDGKRDLGLRPVKRGTYLEIQAGREANMVIKMNFKSRPRLIESNPLVRSNKGRVAIRDGPLIYCIESSDNPDVDIENLAIMEGAPLVSRFDKDILTGIKIIKGTAIDKARNNKLFFNAIPYFAWSNRGKSKMRVWIDKVRD
ncbi:MAG: glycoside hydrolase family 127 protein [Promethearchaeota archaeon]